MDRRAERERRIVAAARELFDGSSVRDASIEDIADAVGINKALIYRHVGSKEELFTLVMVSYLDELTSRAIDLDEVTDAGASLRETCLRYTAFCLEYPAFLDCATALMRHPVEELLGSVSEATAARLGESMAACLHPPARILELGAAAGIFAVDDPDYVANRLYAQVIGTMHLARTGTGVRRDGDGEPALFPIDIPQLQRECVEDAVALARPVDPE